MSSDEELLINLRREVIKHECSLEYLAKKFNLDFTDLYAYLHVIKTQGAKLKYTDRNGVVYVEDFGDLEVNSHNVQVIENDKKEVRILFLSDSRLCSKFAQITHLHRIYDMFHPDYVLLAGDGVEGIYNGKNSIYNQTVLCHDSESQAEYFAKNYPYLKGTDTYFITGEHDLSFLSKEKVDIGKKISEMREDLHYIGQKNGLILLQDSAGNKPVSIELRHNSKKKVAYTISYRPQQAIDAMDSDERPNIIAFGHYLACDTFYHQGVLELQIPSLCATTPEMVDNELNNVMGAVLLTFKLDKKNRIVGDPIRTVMPIRKEQVIKNDYVSYNKTMRKDM